MKPTSWGIGIDYPVKVSQIYDDKNIYKEVEVVKNEFQYQ